MSEIDGLKERVSLIGILGDLLPDSSLEMVYTLKLPCALPPAGENMPAVVREAARYIHGVDFCLISSFDQRVVRYLQEIVMDSVPPNMHEYQSLHGSIGLVNHTRMGVILLGGMDFRYMATEGVGVPLSERLERIDFQRRTQDREELPLLTMETFTRLLKEDPNVWERAIGLMPASAT